MSIANRNLEPGAMVMAQYKGTIYCATLTRENYIGLRWRLEDGRPYKTLSAAGSAVMGERYHGVPRACNGWRFWTLASEFKPNLKTLRLPTTAPTLADAGVAPATTSKQRRATKPAP